MRRLSDRSLWKSWRWRIVEEKMQQGAGLKSRIYPFCMSVRRRRKEGDGWHSSSASLRLKQISQAAIISRTMCLYASD
ncbi:hypothetical protein D8674_002613 [Pyrus ussuriensis x Pyrus communis]|uniref:Uncharacterized protein n=1 Tax=Pyrus ussuriensis x Pyrus communis TaxID=2448454 RepID=A0A5N5FES5_9ROSA|nr:hypothetical protein D8674_002613 [Pyrus ussuriensis x Pyrus communis]